MSGDDEVGVVGNVVLGLVVAATATGVIALAVVWNAVSLAYDGVQSIRRLTRSAS